MPLFTQATYKPAFAKHTLRNDTNGTNFKGSSFALSTFQQDRQMVGTVYSAQLHRRTRLDPGSTKVLTVQVVLASLYCTVSTSSTLGSTKFSLLKMLYKDIAAYG